MSHGVWKVWKLELHAKAKYVTEWLWRHTRWIYLKRPPHEKLIPHIGPFEWTDSPDSKFMYWGTMEGWFGIKDGEAEIAAPLSVVFADFFEGMSDIAVIEEEDARKPVPVIFANAWLEEVGDNLTVVSWECGYEPLFPYFEQLIADMPKAWQVKRIETTEPVQAQMETKTQEPEAQKQPRKPWEHIDLKDWEREALRLWCEEDLTASEIGRRLHYDEKTVRNRFSELRRKYGLEVVPTDDMRKGRDMRDIKAG